MNFEKLFQLLSYSVVICGFLALWVSGTFGFIGTIAFPAVVVIAAVIEGRRWQVSERLGTFLIVAALPLYYLVWRAGLLQFADNGTMVAGVLSRLILTLSAIKILQKKSDRDWIFLYLMAFFEVLLGAGLSISAFYLFSFILYILITVCAVIVFEIRKTGKATMELMAPAADGTGPAESGPVLPARRLPATAIVLIFFMVSVAVPMFFLLPRVGGAGIGGNPGGVSTSAGFSDTVKLGGIGNIQQNDQVVMRVRLESEGSATSNLKWRGIALDTFDNKSWSRRVASKEPRLRGERDLIQIDFATGREGITIQTIYLEPLENPVLFGLPRIVGVQGNFPVLFKDRHGSVSFNRSGERTSYKVLSDRTVPAAGDLRLDRAPYSDDVQNYLQLPEGLDPRIGQLAAQITESSRNRFDRAKAIESYLQNKLGYTLEQKASGDQPLADFLFNVREGHCEYFATAMAVMLRTEGIATRIVNGFSQGEYNEAADVWVVRQRNAHSWVEVYFPGENVWVPFDPTPFSGQVAARQTPGISARVSMYLEALETFWIQYFVSFDNQEQRSLFTSVKRGFADYQSKTSGWMDGVTSTLTEWWAEVRGDNGIGTSAAALFRAGLYLGISGISLFLIVAAMRRIARSRAWKRWWGRLFSRPNASIVEFYERMQQILAEKGFARPSDQTPLEFANAVGMPQVITITEKYNRVRFGDAILSGREAAEVEEWLKELRSAGDRL